MNELKQKILKINSYSLILIIIVLDIISFSVSYIILKSNLDIEIKNIKKEYIKNQKNLMKYQINNFIKYIDTIRKQNFELYKNELKKDIYLISKIIENTNNPYLVKNIIQLHPFFKVGISDLNANKILATTKDYNKTMRLRLIHSLLKSHKDIMFINLNNKKYLYMKKIKNKILTIAFYQKDIDKITKKLAKQYLYAIRFGAKNNGYISIAEILNYKGGKNFAKVVALPVNPKWENKLLSDDKKDAKGKEYRKEYLKIANTTQEGFVTYYFFKYSTNVIRPKISYVKLYKPFNWLIFSSVFIDDIESVINKKIDEFKQEIYKLLIVYIIIYFLSILVAYWVSIKENKIIKTLIEKYEKDINKKNIKLQKLNQNLEEEVKRKTQQLIKQMFTDKLTNLPNREKLFSDLDDNKYIALINIKDFTEINDFYGIDAGDKILKEMANILNNIYTTYKLTADEFAIINKDLEQIQNLSKTILQKVEKHYFIVNKDKIKIKLKIGIGKKFTEADIALKEAKKSKKAIIVYNKNLSILKDIENNLKWKKIIEEAIEKDNVIPFVQPIINNKTEQVEKFECLIRIKHNDKIYSPYFFLEIAKKSSLYSKLQKIMIEKSFKKFSTINYKFSINLSLTDLKNEAFIKFIFDKIAQYNVSNKLIIELLEDEELIKNKYLTELLYRFKEKDIEISLDDFGSGYSNFVYLKDIETDILKIDGSLIKNIHDKKIYEITKKIVEIAKSLNIKVVAEFVENKEILEKLKELNIDFSQGYYFSAPFDINKL